VLTFRLVEQGTLRETNLPPRPFQIALRPRSVTPALCHLLRDRLNHTSQIATLATTAPLLAMIHKSCNGIILKEPLAKRTPAFDATGAPASSNVLS